MCVQQAVISAKAHAFFLVDANDASKQRVHEAMNIYKTNYLPWN